MVLIFLRTLLRRRAEHHRDRALGLIDRAHGELVRAQGAATREATRRFEVARQLEEAAADHRMRAEDLQVSHDRYSDLMSSLEGL